VLVNEFGEIAIDHRLLRRVDEHVLLLGSGCLCCATREDLVAELRHVLEREAREELPRLDRVVIETSGLADPAPILYTLLNDPVLQHHFRIEGVVATVDAVNANLHLTRHPESLQQLAASELAVLTKTDLLGPDEEDQLVARVAAINPAIRIVDAADADRDTVLGGSPRTLTPPVTNGSPAPGGHGDATSLSLSFESAIDWNVFGLWLAMLLHVHGERVLRVKGLLDLGDDGWVSINGVQHVIHPPEHLDSAPDGTSASQLVFILRDLDRERVKHSLECFQESLRTRPPP
jgi:G3E family GTPase